MSLETTSGAQVAVSMPIGTSTVTLTVSGGTRTATDTVDVYNIEREGAALPLTTLDINTGQSNDNGYVFRSSEGQWLYNLDTRAFTTGTYHITIELPDGRNVVGGFVLR